MAQPSSSLLCPVARLDLEVEAQPDFFPKVSLGV
jgi:hypothetical protein